MVFETIMYASSITGAIRPEHPSQARLGVRAHERLVGIRIERDAPWLPPPRLHRRALDATRVLIAEDEALIRLDLREMLQEEGFDVVGEAADGEQAVALARS